MFKKYDLVIYFLIAVGLLGIFILTGKAVKGKPDKIEVYIDNRLAYVYKLSQGKKTYNIDTPNGKAVIVSENMRVRESESPCRNKLCIKQGEISKTGEMIVCLPEKTVVKLVGSVSDVDIIVK